MRDLLEPFGLARHVLGIAGYALILWAAFAWSWRKASRRPGLGSGQSGMRAHAIAGLVGPALVLLHGTSVHGLTGVLVALTLLVAASGVVGRFVYTALPRHVPTTDPGEIARLDAEIAELEADSDWTPDAAAGGDTAVASPSLAHVEAQLRTLRRLRAEHDIRLLRSLARARQRRLLAPWWLLHVPAAAALVVLALVHAIAALYYGALGR